MTQRSLVRYLILCLLLAGLVLLQARLWFGEGSIRNGLLLAQQVDQVKTENAKLTQRNNLMAADISDLKHGTDQVEEIARKDLGMIKQGEVFYQILGDKPVPAPAATMSDATSNATNNATNAATNNAINNATNNAPGGH